MRILVVGAGAIGGYFGGRLVEKGEDVTFLVRENRRRQLKADGLVLNSTHGDFASPVQTIQSGDDVPPFDLILLTVKAYQLEQAMRDIRPYIAASTVILPLLNGYAHYASLTEAFGADTVLGGLCFIEATLDPSGAIVQKGERHDLIFGEWDGSRSERVQTILSHLQDANFTAAASGQIETAIWHKYIFIASMSGITTLMKAPIGPILANAHAKAAFEKLIDEIVAIAQLAGAPVSEDVAGQTLAAAEAVDASMKTSMQRDMEKGLPVEADHLQGALLTLAGSHGAPAADFPVLQAAYGHLNIYEAMRPQG